MKAEQAALEEMPITKHLMVLRNHLFKNCRAYSCLILLFLPFASKTYQVLSEPLRAQLPTSTMIATDVTATFMAPFKLNFFVALFIAMPFILYQIWAFVKPALYEKKKSFGAAFADRQYLLVSISELALLTLSPCHPFCTFSLAFPLNSCPDDRH